ncbi:MAG: rubrerythrin family protein, partial [Paludibacteraceae bacterium]|nr:rubrerythrin family protein [Paludibacteraceae bacterium]
FPEIADMYRNICIAEKNHEDRYRALLENIKNKTVFSKPEKVEWMCRNCGFVITDTNAPESCPACKHSQAYFEVKKTNY